MRKARKIKVKGIEYKYFIDLSSYDYMDDRIYTKVILYLLDGSKAWWNGPPKGIGNREIKEAILSGNFYNYQGILRV